MVSKSKTKDYIYVVISVILGIVTFIKLNEFTGPTFEPIVKACTDSSIPIEEFVAKTGYHIYEPKVGLGVFNFLVCLITQFLLELRGTYPAGLLTWVAVIIVSLPIAVCGTVEAGRGGAKGLIRYPVILGLCAQLFGISVTAPLLIVPGLILGGGKGVVSEFRAKAAAFQVLPSIVLTTLVFICDTDGYLWTVCAGMLGGPILAMFPLLLWTDKAPSESSADLIKASSNATVKSYLTLVPVGLSMWVLLVYVALSTFGNNMFALWDAIWVNANVSVKFMTIDSLILFVSFLMYISYLSFSMAIRVLFLTPMMGPGAAACFVLAKYEENNLCMKLKKMESKTK